jgi:hypothetical protein
MSHIHTINYAKKIQTQLYKTQNTSNNLRERKRLRRKQSRFGMEASTQ